MPKTTNSLVADSGVLLDERGLSGMLGVSVRTVQAWRVKGGGPVFVKINNRLVRYRQSDVEAWLTSLLASNTSVLGPSKTSSKPADKFEALRLSGAQNAAA